MAKVSYTKLGLTKNQEIQIVEWNEQKIEVKQYLPINDKLELISDVINLSADENNFSNPVKVDMFTKMMIVEYYTNINFTEKQKEDWPKLFDAVYGSGLWKAIKEAMDVCEVAYIYDSIDRSVKSIYSYRNSALGILDTIMTDYSNLNLEAGEIQQKLADPNNMELLKSVLDKLG